MAAWAMDLEDLNMNMSLKRNAHLEINVFALRWPESVLQSQLIPFHEVEWGWDALLHHLPKVYVSPR